MQKKTKIYHGTVEVLLTDKTSFLSEHIDDSGYLLLKTIEPNEQKEVKFRRVNNPDAMLQFEMVTYKNGRRRIDSFSVPEALTKEFLEHLSKNKN